MSGWVVPERATNDLSSQRPAWVTAGAVILLAVATLSGLMGLLFIVMGVAMGSIWREVIAADPSLPAGFSPEAFSGMMTAIFVAISLVVLVWAAANGAAGVGILRGRGWARILGLVVASIGLVFTALAMGLMAWSSVVTADAFRDPRLREAYGAYGSSEMLGAGVALTLLFILPFLIAYGVVLVALSRNGAFFRRQTATLGSGQ